MPGHLNREKEQQGREPRTDVLQQTAAATGLACWLPVPRSIGRDRSYFHDLEGSRRRTGSRQICRHRDFCVIQSANEGCSRSTANPIGYRAPSIAVNIGGHLAGQSGHIDKHRKRFLWQIPPRLKTSWNERRSSGQLAKRPLPRPSGPRPAAQPRRRSKSSHAACPSAKQAVQFSQQRLRKRILPQPLRLPVSFRHSALIRIRTPR